jgi:hypothetical protein
MPKMRKTLIRSGLGPAVEALLERHLRFYSKGAKNETGDVKVCSIVLVLVLLLLLLLLLLATTTAACYYYFFYYSIYVKVLMEKNARIQQILRGARTKLLKVYHHYCTVDSCLQDDTPTVFPSTPGRFGAGGAGAAGAAGAAGGAGGKGDTPASPFADATMVDDGSRAHRGAASTVLETKAMRIEDFVRLMVDAALATKHEHEDYAKHAEHGSDGANGTNGADGVSHRAVTLMLSPHEVRQAFADSQCVFEQVDNNVEGMDELVFTEFVQALGSIASR